MIKIETQRELELLVGQEIGTSDWMLIDQPMIDNFAEATGDRQWIHVDEKKAKLSPFGATIAHGFLLLSLLPKLKAEIAEFSFAKAVINYGSDKVRFLAPVKVGSRVKLKVFLVKLEAGPSGLKIFTKNNLQLEGSQKDALVADTITLVIQ